MGGAKCHKIFSPPYFFRSENRKSKILQSYIRSIIWDINSNKLKNVTAGIFEENYDSLWHVVGIFILPKIRPENERFVINLLEDPTQSRIFLHQLTEEHFPSRMVKDSSWRNFFWARYKHAKWARSSCNIPIWAPQYGSLWKNSSLLSKVSPLGTLIVWTITRLFRRVGKSKALPVDLQWPFKMVAIKIRKFVFVTQ
jgi:hypothetical protein